MFVFHHKRRTFAKINILITLISLWAFTVTNGSAATTTGWGDIVDVNYSLWTDAAHTIEVPDNIDVDLTYIYLSRGSSVPESLQTVFPSASASYITKFKEELIGIEVGAQKDFMIPSEDAYQDGRDLYYRVILLRIHHDASSFRQGITGGDAILILGVAGIVAVGGILYWRTTTSKQRKHALSSEGMSSARREKSIKQKKNQLRELRELAESRGSEMDVEKEPPKRDDVKFRRRR